MRTEVAVLLPPPLTDRGTSYTCGRIAQGMAGPHFDVVVVTPRSARRAIEPARTLQVLPYWMRRIPYGLLRAGTSDRVEAAFLRHVSGLPPGRRAAYVWAHAELPTLEALRREGIPVFREMINGPRGAAKAILDEAYARCGEPPSHGIDEASIAQEDAALALADHVFCPNAQVEAALRRRGVPAARLVETSYGWDPRRFAGTERLLPPAPGLTALFVGTLSIRKGVHLLMDYWVRSGVRGRLVLAGTMEPMVRRHCARWLARDDVIVLDYVADVGKAYRSADLFVFPTLEEGGPQVTYEACGCGLAVVTTPMGAGRMVRHDREGLVLDPYDEAGWLAALRMMAEDVGRRRVMAASATRRAQDFRWDTVAHQRRKHIASRLEAAVASRSLEADDAPPARAVG